MDGSILQGLAIVASLLLWTPVAIAIVADLRSWERRDAEPASPAAPANEAEGRPARFEPGSARHTSVGTASIGPEGVRRRWMNPLWETGRVTRRPPEPPDPWASADERRARRAS